jgi:hypothetical protein
VPRQFAASAPSSDVLRRVAAGVLLRASIALERLAAMVGPAPPPAWSDVRATLEFHAADDLSGGALYADGVLVGRLDGVRRL